jgi:heme/copper-type cytochrome/quinol oxidase subunit 2
MMRLIALQACAAITALLFVIALVVTVAHRGRRDLQGADRSSALSEYLWTLIPWGMVVAAAFPAVQLIVSGR